MLPRSYPGIAPTFVYASVNIGHAKEREIKWQEQPLINLA
jgi:hypothetical protein